MKKNIKPRKKARIKINFFNVFMLASACLGAYVLIHDLLVWAIIPLFTGDFVMLTYFGMFVDLTALGLIELTVQMIKES